MDSINKRKLNKSNDVCKISTENIRYGIETLHNLIIEVVNAPLQLGTVTGTLKMSLFK